MTEIDRRHAKRLDATVPVSLSITEPFDIEGETVNVSSKGVLLLARGRFCVALGIRDRTYRGRLVRAAPADANAQMTEYAIELEEVLGREEFSTGPLSLCGFAFACSTVQLACGKVGQVEILGLISAVMSRWIVHRTRLTASPPSTRARVGRRSPRRRLLPIT